VALLGGRVTRSASPSTRQIAVSGLAELVRAFDVLEGKTKSEVRDALVKAGEPVRSAAEQYAVADIRNIGDQWSQMRLGITPRMVYIAPRMRSRRRASKRKNLAVLLLDRSMWPAAARHEHEVLDGLEHAIDDLTREEGF
jgi:hypothetical protein